MKVITLISLLLLLTGCDTDTHLCEYAGESEIKSVTVNMEGIGMMADRVATITMDNGIVITEYYRPSRGYRIGTKCHTWDCARE